MKIWTLFLGLLLVPLGLSQTHREITRPTLVSAQVKGTVVVYRVDGRRVEDTRRNSLLNSLGTVVRDRGVDAPVLIIVDERAAFREVGKLETALDKAGLTNRRLFVADFRDGTMNEIHWEQSAIPIPPSTTQ